MRSISILNLLYCAITPTSSLALTASEYHATQYLQNTTNQTTTHTESSINATLIPLPPVQFYYNQEYGVKYSEIAHHPRSFDDTALLIILDDSLHYRALKTFSCTALLRFIGHGILTGIQTKYAYNDDLVSSPFRGWTNLFSFHRTYSYTLSDTESFNRFQIRQCHGKFTGLVIGVSGSWGEKWDTIRCGNWRFEDSETGCEEWVLGPDSGYKVVGIYGDANDVLFTKRQGVRGLGLITVKE